MRLLLLGLWGMIACVHRPRPSDHLFPQTVTIMGHRGARGLAPENTPPAFDIARELGIPFELDTMVCGSGELVVIHDETLDRTTDGSGAVSETPLATIRTLRADQDHDVPVEGAVVPTLDAVLEAYGEDVLVNIEVKAEPGANAAALAGSVADVIEARGLVERVIVTSFNPFVLAALRERNPAIFRGQLYGTFKGTDLGWFTRTLLKNLAFNRRVQPDLLMAEAALITPRYARKMHRRGYRIIVWTVNDPVEARRLIDAGVDGIITDRPDLLRDLRPGR
ncbi:MAG: glycerophosphodiester phosphodiesterase family protein [Myxococcota bacterium]